MALHDVAYEVVSSERWLQAYDRPLADERNLMRQHDALDSGLKTRNRRQA